MYVCITYTNNLLYHIVIVIVITISKQPQTESPQNNNVEEKRGNDYIMYVHLIYS